MLKIQIKTFRKTVMLIKTLMILIPDDVNWDEWILISDSIKKILGNVYNIFSTIGTHFSFLVFYL